jgi:sulfate transport system permease protein
MSWADFSATVSHPRVLASLKLSFGASFIAALINTLFGFILAWVLVRYPFKGRVLVDAMIDLPFALPTAVAGLALCALYAPKGWLGQYAAAADLKIAFAPAGIVIALVFVSMPFVVRTVQPVLQDLEQEQEEAALCLGASPTQTFWQVIFPGALPAIITGFTLAFARSIGEFGSVVFIAGNLPMISEVTPLLIYSKLEQFDYNGAAALALIMLMLSLGLLLLISGLQRWIEQRYGLHITRKH